MKDSARGPRQWSYLVGVALLVTGTAVTRIYRLTSWPLFGDEFYTLTDSLNFSFSFARRPLLYWLNHELVQPFLTLDELGLRLLPVLFGIIGVVAVTEMGRRLVNRRAGLLAGLLTLCSPWHLAWSQMARYYTLVFLLAAVSPAALYLGIRERSYGWIAAGVLTAGLAWFAHPTAILPTAGFLVWLAGYGVLRADRSTRRVLLGTAAVAAVGGLVAAWALLSQWSSLEQTWGIGGLWVAVSYGVRLSAGPALAAAAGVGLLWLDGRRELSAFLALAVAVPVALMGVLGEFVAVHTGFLFATAPYALLAAGAFLDRTIGMVEAGARRWVVGIAVTGVVVATGLPSFVSHYVDGGRADFRRAARHIEKRAEDSDLVLASQTGPFGYYAPSLDARPLPGDTARLDSIYRSVSRRARGRDLWVVPNIRSAGGFGLQGLGSARHWVWRHCRLSARVNPVRIDHQRNIVEVWRCGGSTN